jgi:glycosyltransferase involved in cell wall biosynthesis
LRNIAVEAAAGEVICQWDDDDLYHPERLRVQFDAMLRGEARACLMSDYLQFFHEEREMFWVDWTNRTTNPRHHLLPGTLLMYKDARFKYPEVGAQAERGEDDDLIDQMYPVVRIVSLSGAGYLYVYTYHGGNTFSRDHHTRLAIESSSSPERIVSRREPLVEALGYYRLPMPYVVRTREERLFVYNR